MAGITAMGDLSHELETLVMQVDNGSVPTDDAMFDVIQASLDDLARMREAVANGRRVSSARAMIARIHSLSKPRGAAAPGPHLCSAVCVDPGGAGTENRRKHPTDAQSAPASDAKPTVSTAEPVTTAEPVASSDSESAVTSTPTPRLPRSRAGPLGAA